MKKIFFYAVCSIVLFAIACNNANESKNNIHEVESVIYAIDPLDVELTKIEKENVNISSIKGEEIVEETDEGIIRHCPVKFINCETGDVKDSIFVFAEKY